MLDGDAEGKKYKLVEQEEQLFLIGTKFSVFFFY